MPLMDPIAASSRDPDALLATIAKLSAEAAERELQIARIEAEKLAFERSAAEAEAREIIALAAVSAAKAQVAGMRDELAAARDEVKRLSEIVDLFKRHRFGRSSEKLDPDQYELVLEELETALSRAEAGLQALVDKGDETGEQKERRRRSNRGALPAHLERIEQVVDITDKHCACCGGDLHVIGEDVTERLDVVPAKFRVLVTRRPRYGCRGCDEGGVRQAPAPDLVVDQGLPTDALVAQVLISRYADHLPLYRQAQIYARYGVDLDRATLASWVGRAAWWLRPLRDHLLAQLKSSVKLFADETRMPVLAPGTGKTKTGQLWAYARDDRPWAGTAPPAVVYMYATGRGGAHPIEHLGAFTGVLQVDGYAGYNEIRRRGAVLALCLSHARRKFYELKDKEPVAAEVLRRFAALYAIEAKLRGSAPEARLAGRQASMATLLTGLKDYLAQNRRRFSAKSKMAEAINYTLSHWDGLTRFMDDGRIELDTNVVERSIRPIALSRRNSLFAGSDTGADNWAIIASLIETCKLNGVDPLAWLSTTLSRLANGHRNNNLDALMPWHFPKIVGRASQQAHA